MSAYEQGLITEEEIRKSTVRLMTLRLQLGMVGDETPFDSIPYSVIDCDIHRNTQRRSGTQIHGIAQK